MQDAEVAHTETSPDDLLDTGNRVGHGLLAGDGGVPEFDDLVGDGADAIYGKLGGVHAQEGVHLTTELIEGNGFSSPSRDF